MTRTPSPGTADHAVIRCVLDLRYDGTLAVTATHGCTESDVHDLLDLLHSAHRTPDDPTGTSASS